jgi:hypothetical protein
MALSRASPLPHVTAFQHKNAVNLWELACLRCGRLGPKPYMGLATIK